MGCAYYSTVTDDAAHCAERAGAGTIGPFWRGGSIFEENYNILREHHLSERYRGRKRRRGADVEENNSR